MSVITIEQLANGMGKCEKIHPIVEFSLSPELNRLSEVAGIMNAYKLDSIDTEDFPRLGLGTEILEEVNRWVLTQ